MAKASRSGAGFMVHQISPDLALCNGPLRLSSPTAAVVRGERRSRRVDRGFSGRATGLEHHTEVRAASCSSGRSQIGRGCRASRPGGGWPEMQTASACWRDPLGAIGRRAKIDRPPARRVHAHAIGSQALPGGLAEIGDQRTTVSEPSTSLKESMASARRAFRLSRSRAIDIGWSGLWSSWKFPKASTSTNTWLAPSLMWPA